MHLVSQTILLIWVMVMEILGISFQTHFRANRQLRRKKETHSLDIPTREDIGLPRDIGKAGTQTDYSSVEHLSDGFSVPMGHPGSDSRVPKFQSPTNKPNDRNAKGFWNHFLYRRRSGFQYVLPIQNNEVRQEKCRAIPFWQRVSHEDCEPQLLKNNVCFGKCGTPLTSDDSTACLLCSPVKLIQKAVQLKCKDSAEVTKDIKMVEECQCKEHTGRHFINRGEPVLIDPSIGN
ncbi:hypothetical protein AALO_G00014390 [Alosa alosa]|uniref:CTCK domain-containing protein n=1 Tax=Alosa alosa TaxID=278164 RepID=A0AAV6HGD4_9TELE|nr:hypothetical protein AALO_G00014390 [Alosa alosa]